LKGFVHLADQARDSLRAAARSSLKREHGGILVGYRSGRVLYVYDALTVPDEASNSCTYTRRSSPAEEILGSYLGSGYGSLIGYVGEWHTHSLLVPPSSTDRQSMRQISRINKQAAALIVASLDPGSGKVHFFGLLSRPSRRFVGDYCDVVIHHSSASEPEG
jgi:integrative and conjugative element protein (TIGR02256 family)